MIDDLADRFGGLAKTGVAAGPSRGLNLGPPPRAPDRARTG
jgi:hypothetical protein